MERSPVCILVILLLVVIAVSSCSLFGKKKEIKPLISEVVHPEWSKNSVMYEVNVRQYTDSGTFRAFEKHLPRLKEMGIDILWFMPAYPIGVLNRKDELGSYYSVRD
ncbi:MAG: alpha amylase catalytic region, partial [Bacteroidetes bacterium]|nr:alpha amylase catalytic region [Bacteroidota bacterium]